MNRKRETMNIAKRVKRQYAKRRKTAIEMFLRREWKNPADEYLRQPNDAREEKAGKISASEIDGRYTRRAAADSISKLCNEKRA